MTRAGATILGLLLLSSVAAPVRAEVVVKVPAGEELKASLQGATVAVRIQNAPRIVEFQFGWQDASRQFRAYAKTEPIVYDREFFVRARYDVEPQFAKTLITLFWDGGTREVPMFKTRENPLVFESTGLSFPNLEGCKGLTICEPQEDWGRAN